jgi:hypothetical protein
MHYHYVVVYEIKDARFVVADGPGARAPRDPHATSSSRSGRSNALLLDPTPELAQTPKSPPILHELPPVVPEGLVASRPGRDPRSPRSSSSCSASRCRSFLQYFVDSILPSGKADAPRPLRRRASSGSSAFQAGIEVGEPKISPRPRDVAAWTSMFSTLFVRRLLELPLGVLRRPHRRRHHQAHARAPDGPTDRPRSRRSTIVTLVLGGGPQPRRPRPLQPHASSFVLLACLPRPLAFVRASTSARSSSRRLREVHKAESAWQTRSRGSNSTASPASRPSSGEVAARWKLERSDLYGGPRGPASELGNLEAFSRWPRRSSSITASAPCCSSPRSYLFSRGELTAGHVLATSLLVEADRRQRRP